MYVTIHRIAIQLLGKIELLFRAIFTSENETQG